MRRISKAQVFLLLTFAMLFINSCAKTESIVDKNGGNDMQEKINPISDFEKLRRKELPESNKSQIAENVAKIYFYEVENLLRTEIIIIDLQNKVAQINPDTAHFFGDADVAEFEIKLSDKDVETVVNILKEGNVSKWQRKYRYGDESMLEQMGGEGYNWTLFIQYKDGTMQPRSGKGTSKEEIQPEGYQTFVNELTTFVEGKK